MIFPTQEYFLLLGLNIFQILLVGILIFSVLNRKSWVPQVYPELSGARVAMCIVLWLPLDALICYNLWIFSPTLLSAAIVGVVAYGRVKYLADMFIHAGKPISYKISSFLGTLIRQWVLFVLLIGYAESYYK